MLRRDFSSMKIALRICRESVFLSICLVALLFTGGAMAQRNSDMAKATALLKPDERTIVTRLGDLHELPAGTWKMHAGDIAHAEDANFDDSSWPTIKVGQEAPNEAIWLRQTVQVPETLDGYDLTGARIWF